MSTLDIQLFFNLIIISLFGSTLYEKPSDGLWGNIVDMKNNKWNGIVKELMEKSADFCSAELTISPQRSKVIRFGTTLTSSKMSIITKLLPAAQNMDLMAFLKIFHIHSWLSYFVYLCVFALTMTAVQNIFQSSSIGILQKLSNLLMYSLQLGEINIQAKNVSGTLTIKVLTISALFMMFILYNFYSAFLTSLMSSQNEPKKINSFQDLVTQDYKIVTMKASFIHSIMKEYAKKDSSIAQLVQNMNPESDYLSTLGEIGQRLLSSKSAAIAGEDKTEVMGGSLIQFHSGLSNFFPVIRRGFGYPLDSEFAGCFDYHLNKIKESGVLSYIIAKWTRPIHSEGIANGDLTSENAFEIDLQNVAFLVLTLLIGCGASVVLCLFEIIISIIHKQIFQTRGNEEKMLF